MRIDMGTIESNDIVEASGIAASRKNPGVLWTHNDSGVKNSVFAFNSQGKHLGNFIIAGIQNRDWEDIAVGPGPIAGELAGGIYFYRIETDIWASVKKMLLVK